jgi:hypothetical protein
MSNNTEKVLNDLINATPKLRDSGFDYSLAVRTLRRYENDVTLFDLINLESLSYWSRYETYKPLMLLSEVYMDLEAVIAREDNLYATPPANASWLAGFQYNVAQFLKLNALPVALPYNRYSWVDYEVVDNERKVVAIFKISDSTWEEPVDVSDEEKNVEKFGIEAVAVYDDKTTRIIRWEGSMEQMLLTFLSGNFSTV